LKNPFNPKEPIYPLVSIDSTGFNENMAQEIIASWKEAVRIYNAVTLGLLVVVLFFSSMLVRELLPERISKKDSEKLVLREKRKAERRAKYLEERQRQREAKQKKKH